MKDIKVCRTCFEEHPASDFLKDGRHCSQCRSTYYKDHKANTDAAERNNIRDHNRLARIWKAPTD